MARVEKVDQKRSQGSVFQEFIKKFVYSRDLYLQSTSMTL